MFELELWLLAAYVLGTGCGWYMAYRKSYAAAIDVTIDNLINQGYVKHRRRRDGEIEIIKWNEDFD